jgi:peptidoglycan/xylan/chitin deacetylase (PgdA/CDA1 family)
MMVQSVIKDTPDHRLAILSFHKIGDPSPGCWNSWFYIPERPFAGYLSFLKENRWNVIDMPAFLAGLRAPEKLPERTVLLTFDDGYRSVRDVALPWLRRFGFPAVSFVSTGYVGGCSTFDGGVEPEEPLCDWEDLRELQRQGVSIQSHGVLHRGFSALGPAEREEELVRSKAEIESRLANGVDVFAFPYGDNGPDPQATAEALKRAGYRAACLYGGGPNPLPVADSYRLTRLAMGPDTDLKRELERNAAETGGGS